LGALVDAIANNKLDLALEKVNVAVASNADMLVFLKLLLHRLRTILLLRYAPEMQSDFAEQFSDEDFRQLTELAKNKSAGITSKTLATLLGAYAETPRAYIKQLPLELALTDLLASKHHEKDE
jgi:DNA polymerase III gamma/tau subunit